MRFVWLVLLLLGFIGCSETAKNLKIIKIIRPIGTPNTLAVKDRPPIGSLDGATSEGLAWGWALDEDTPLQSSTVHFYVDDLFVEAMTAELLRPDVNLAKAVAGDHGFAFIIPFNFRDGQRHTLQAYVIDAVGGTNPLLPDPRLFTIDRTTPIGTIDGINPDGSYWGWAFDRNNTSPSVAVHFYVDQHAGNLLKFEGGIGPTTANFYRRDVNEFYKITGNHGYSFTMPWYLRDGRTHTLYAYGIDTNGGSNQLIGIKTFRVTPTVVPGLKYYGYFASAMDGVGTGDYTNQIADHANVSWIQGNEITKLQDASARNMKGIISLFWYLFKFDENDKPVLHERYRENWAALAAKIRPYINDIAAFYPIDEPYWNDKTKTCPMEIRPSIETVISMIKADFPATPVAVLFAVPCVTSDLIIPIGYDWVGFDCYGSFVGCGGPGQSVPWYATTLLSRMDPNQKMILAPDGTYSDTCPSPLYQNELALRAEQYYSLALSEPRVIGMFTFLYQSDGTGTGTQCMPMVLYQWTRIGKAIKASLHDDH